MTRIVIVDESDSEIGVKNASERRIEDIYRVTALWLTNTKGEALLAQRASTKKDQPGLWGPAVSGTVEDGEDYESNIVKETQEEIGISVSLRELTIGPKIRMRTPLRNYFTQWYLCVLDKPAEELVPRPGEVDAVRWVPLSEIEKEFTSHPERFVVSAPQWITRFVQPAIS